MSIKVNSIYEDDTIKILWVLKYSIFKGLPKCVRHYIVKFELPCFNILKIKNPNVLVIGRRRSGKTWLIIDMINNLCDKCDYERILICAPTEEKYTEDAKIQIIHKFDEDIISRVIQKQIERIQKGIQKKLLVVIDDSMMRNQIECHIMRDILLNGKHYNITLMVTMQYPHNISPILRTNFDYIVVLCEYYITNRKTIYNQYFSYLPNFVTFNNMFDKLQPFEALIYDAHNDPNKVYRYKATQIN